MEIGITKISSKGQVVIPVEMRQGFEEGQKLVVFRNKGQLIMKHANKFDENLREDMEFARKTEEAYQRILNNEGKAMEFDDFIEEMKKW